MEKNLKLFVCFELTIRNGTFRIQSIMDIECILTTLSVFVYPFKFLGGYGFEKDLEEEHTRELQVEQAYKLFQSALKLQKQKQYESAYKVYEELFKLDIVSNHYFEELDFIRGLQDGSQNTDTDELTLLSPM